MQASPAGTLSPPSMMDPNATLGPRGPAESVSLELRSVPTVDVSAPTRVEPSFAPTKDFRVSPDGDSIRRFSFREQPRTLAIVRHDGAAGPELTVPCVGAPPTPIEWDTLTFLPSGRALYTVHVGMVDAKCRVLEARAQSVELAPLVAGAAFAVRRCDGLCQPTTPLTVLTPALVDVRVDELGTPLLVGPGPLSSVDLPVRRGSAASLDAAIDRAALRTLFGAPSEGPAKTRGRLGIDVSQSATEPSAVVVAYYSEESIPEQPPEPPTDELQIDF